MKQLSRENILLLCVMFLASVATFSYFPYLTTALVEYLGLTNFGMASIVAFGILAGNFLSYLASLTISSHLLLPRLRLAFMLTAISISLIFIAKFSANSVALVIVAASILIYRFAIGLAANTSRALQIQYLPRPDQKSRLFSYIKFSSSAGGAIGPILGSYAIHLDGFPGVMKLSGFLFVCSVALLLSIKRRAPPADVPIKKSPGLWRTLRLQSPLVYLVSLTAAIHYIFEAQIYTAISINIQHNNSNYVDLISLLFAANSILLVLLIIPVLELVNRKRNKFWLLAFGSFLSMTAVISSAFIDSSITTVAVALLFTVGEIITPQLMIDLVTDVEDGENAVSALATFNLLTMGVGLSVGYWLGGLVSTAFNFYENTATWIAVYVIFLILAFLCEKMPRKLPPQTPGTVVSS